MRPHEIQHQIDTLADQIRELHVKRHDHCRVADACSQLIREHENDRHELRLELARQTSKPTSEVATLMSCMDDYLVTPDEGVAIHLLAEHAAALRDLGRHARDLEPIDVLEEVVEQHLERVNEGESNFNADDVYKGSVIAHAALWAGGEDPLKAIWCVLELDYPRDEDYRARG